MSINHPVAQGGDTPPVQEGSFLSLSLRIAANADLKVMFDRFTPSNGFGNDIH